jgi:hypothetical protein
MDETLFAYDVMDLDAKDAQSVADLARCSNLPRRSQEAVITYPVHIAWEVGLSNALARTVDTRSLPCEDRSVHCNEAGLHSR